MSLSKSRLAYDDCYKVMDQALELNGARIEVGDGGRAKYLRMRFNGAREIDRKENRDTYDPSHQLYGRSVYDKLVFRVKEDTEGGWWVYLELEDVSKLHIEPLEDVV